MPLTEQHGPIVITMPAHYYGPIVLEGLRVFPTAPGQTAITITCPTSPSVAEVTVILRDVHIRPGFVNGVVLTNAWNAQLTGLNIYGAYDGDMQNAVILRGQSHDVRIDGLTAMHAVTGVLVDDACEGTVISRSTLLGVTYGVFAASSFAGRPWLVIGDCHIAATRAGIVAVKRNEVVLRDTLIYRHLREHRGTDPWNGVMLMGCTRTIVRDVLVNGAPDAAQVYPGTSQALYTDTPLLRSDLFAVNCTR